MWTEAGLAWLAQTVAENADRLTLVISDGQGEEVSRAIPGSAVQVDGSTATITMTLGEDEANFDWRERRVVFDGTVIDEDLTDQGRKVQGAIWTVAVTFDMQA